MNVAPAPPESPPEQHDDVGGVHRQRGTLVLGFLTIGLVGAAVLAAGIGAYPVAPSDVLGELAHRLGLRSSSTLEPTASALLWEIRWPRVVLAALVGGSLGAAGATMQGTLANPLAEPGVIGVSAGAALGAVTQIALGWAPLGTLSLPAAAFLGGLVTVFVVYASARAEGRTEVVTLVLTGIAVNAFVGALIGFVTFASDDAELRSIVFWTLGSMAQATWSKVLLVTPFAVAGLAMCMTLGRNLDLLALGERPAAHLGVHVERLRAGALAVTAVLTAAAVAVSGQLAFVGLVVPHVVRLTLGPRHRLLLPAAALLGGLAVVVADLAARTLAAPAELPLGALTALVGAPFFAWQRRRTRRQHGGWA